MKQLLQIVMCIFILSSCSDKVDLDDSQSKTFNKFYGNAGSDRGVAIRELNDGTFLTYGTIQTSTGSTDLTLIKTDKFGNELWTKTYGSSDAEEAGGFDIDESGKIIMVGTTTKSITDENEANYSDIIVVETDPSGNEIDRWTFDYNDNEIGKAILYDRSEVGGFVLCGSTDAQRDQTNEFTSNPKFSKDFFILRYYFDEQIQNVDTNIFQAGFEVNDEAVSISHIDNSNNFLVAVNTFLQNKGSNQMGYIEIINTVDGGTFNNFNPDLGFSAATTANQIIQTPTGYALVGAILENKSSLIIQEIANDFKLLESYSVVKNQSVNGNSVYFNADSKSFIVCGSTNNNSNGGFDHYIASINQETKNINWEKTYGGSGEEEALAIWPTKDGGYIFTGYSGFEGNSLINTIKVDNKGILNP